MLFDLIFFPLLAVVLFFARREHLKARGKTDLFWAGTACLIGWTLYIALLGNPTHWDTLWMLGDAPLNFGWVILLSWPFLVESWRSSQQNWKQIKFSIAEMRRAWTAYRVQVKSLDDK